MTNQKENALINLLRQVKDELDKYNVEFWLDWGTLLGAVRSGRFIPWDHDIDLGVWREKLPETLKTAISRDLRRKGFEVVVGKTYVHIPGGEEKIHADINLYHLSNGKAIMFSYGVLHWPYMLLRHLVSVLTDQNKCKVDFKHTPIGKSLVKVSLIKLSRLLPSSLRRSLAQFLLGIYKRFGLVSFTYMISDSYFMNLSTINFYGMEFKVPAKAKEFLAHRYGNDWNIPRSPSEGWKNFADTRAILTSTGKTWKGKVYY